MPGGIRRADIEDVEIVDAIELASTGLTSFATGISVVSTTASTKQVVFSAIDIIHDQDYKLEPYDLVVLVGDAAGIYTVDTIVNATTITISEVILDSTGGSASFRYPAGALSVGVNPTNLSQSSSEDLQHVLEDLDGAISGGGITEAQHRVLKQLIHFIDDGPAEGFTSGAYKETTPSGDIFPTAEIWWESSSKLKKIVSLDTTWTGIRVTQEVWKVYDTDGSTVLATITDAISYSGITETSRTRTIVVS